jgi:hypothetical protein
MLFIRLSFHVYLFGEFAFQVETKNPFYIQYMYILPHEHKPCDDDSYCLSSDSDHKSYIERYGCQNG